MQGDGNGTDKPCIINYARFICTICMRRIRWSCEGLTSVHNEYTGYLLKHLLLRHMYNLLLPVLMCYAQALRSETSYCYYYYCVFTRVSRVWECAVAYWTSWNFWNKTERIYTMYSEESSALQIWSCLATVRILLNLLNLCLTSLSYLSVLRVYLTS